MTQTQQKPQQEATHPFDMEKSDFEKLLDRDFRPMERAVQDILDAQHDANFTRAVKMARAVDRLKMMLNDDVMGLLLPLMNTRLGFRCDRPSKKNPKPYDVEEIRSCMIEALIRGAFLTGNEFNIIANNCYFTKEFFWRKIQEHPDVMEFTPVPGLPHAKERGAVVLYKCTYRMKGEKELRTIEREIPVKTDEYSTADQILGKADRKMWATVWNSISGWREPIPDGEIGDTPLDTNAAPAETTRTEQTKKAIEQAQQAKGAESANSAPSQAKQQAKAVTAGNVPEIDDAAPPVAKPAPVVSAPSNTALGRRRGLAKQEPAPAPVAEPVQSDEPVIDAPPTVQPNPEVAAQAYCEGKIEDLRAELASASVDTRKRPFIESAKVSAGVVAGVLIKDLDDDKIRELAFFFKYDVLTKK